MSIVMESCRIPYGGQSVTPLSLWINEIPLCGPDEDPSEALFEILDRRWVVFILKGLAPGPLRFNEIANLKSINSNTLANRLRELEMAKLIEREVLSYMPPHVEYRLTEEGKRLADLICALQPFAKDWAQRRHEEQQSAVIQAAEPLEARNVYVRNVTRPEGKGGKDR